MTHMYVHIHYIKSSVLQSYILRTGLCDRRHLSVSMCDVENCRIVDNSPGSSYIERRRVNMQPFERACVETCYNYILYTSYYILDSTIERHRTEYAESKPFAEVARMFRTLERRQPAASSRSRRFQLSIITHTHTIIYNSKSNSNSDTYTCTFTSWRSFVVSLMEHPLYHRQRDSRLQTTD